MRVPITMVEECLRQSGRECIFLREPLTAQKPTVAATVIWGAETRKEALKKTVCLQGFLGLARDSRSRIGWRIQDTELATARQHLCPHKITGQNAGVVPRTMWETAGWPVGCSSAVAAEALGKWGWNALPVRSYVNEGQFCWVAAAETEPPASTFSTSGGIIVVQPQQQTQQKARRPSKSPQNRGRKPPSDHTSGANNNAGMSSIIPPGTGQRGPRTSGTQHSTEADTRLQDLERRMGLFETRIDQVEVAQQKAAADMQANFNQVFAMLRAMAPDRQPDAADARQDSRDGKRPRAVDN